MNLLLENWFGLLPEPWSHVVLTLSAVVCGAIVGSEREKREKAAGLRTLVLVCLGSATFTMVSFAFGTNTGDTGRVAAQIVTGIGFIGAGVIMHGRNAVTGLTTAATVWAMAAVGIVAGVGFIGAALGLSLLIRTLLTSLSWWERRVMGESRSITVEMLIDLDHGKTRFQVERLMDEFQVHSRLEFEAGSDEATLIKLSFALPRRYRIEFLSELAALKAVRDIRQTQTQTKGS